MVTLTSFTVSDDKDGFHRVKLVYECKTKLDTEVPIGTNPANAPNPSLDSKGAFAGLTVKLSKQ